MLLVVASSAAAARTAADPAAAETAAPANGPVARTPVLSARRVPGALQRSTGVIRLTDALDAVFADPRLAGARDHSCLVVAANDSVVYARNGAAPVIPASNLKLLTALAVLDKIGADARLSTDVKADQAPAGGVVNGNLYLVGGGDPLIRTADYNASFQENALPPDGYTHLEAIAQAVVDAGVRHVTGAVVGDESRYDAQRYVPTWKPRYITDSESGPISALQVNQGFVTTPPNLPVAAPAPAVLASGSLSALLAKMGVQVDGQPAQGVTPASAVPIASQPSLPMQAIVGEMLRESDNLTAETLVKELGRRFGGAGTTVAGVAVIHQDAAARGLPASDLASVDGSGLDRSDRVTCNLLLSAVTKAGPNSALAAGLPVAGRTGTLRKRFLGTPAVDRVAAKTGSLDNVSSLTGFVRPSTPQQPTLSFSLVGNEYPTDAIGRAVQDRVAVTLASYPNAPDLAVLGPLDPVAP